MKWRGRLGVVILGPAQDRVARLLEDRTRYGRVTLRSTMLCSELGMTRSEFYRITVRLRMLGLFGIQNDRGGTLGGRRYWRTATRREGSALDPQRHRHAWARITGWLKRAGVRAAARVRAYSHVAVYGRLTPAAHGDGGGARPMGIGGAPPHAFRDAMRRLAPALAGEWGL